MIFNVDDSVKTKCGVYKITNLINGKFYIGSTTRSFFTRYKEHKCCFKTGVKNCRILMKAFTKNGINNFEFSVVLICNKEDCVKNEQYFLDLGSDYNCCKVADSVLGLKRSKEFKEQCSIRLSSKKIPVDKYTLSGLFICSYKGLREAKRDVNASDVKGISSCCKGNASQCCGFKWAFKNQPLKKFNKKIYSGKKIALQRGNFYKEFNNTSEAARYIRKETNFKCDPSNLRKSIKKPRIAFGFNVIDLSKKNQ